MLSVQHAIVVVLLLHLSSLVALCVGVRPVAGVDGFRFEYSKAPDYRNGVECPVSEESVSFDFQRKTKIVSVCAPSLVHVAITLDSEYLRGSIAAVNSVLWHSSCPENIFFHFLVAESDVASPRGLSRLVRSTFPLLNFKVYIFREERVIYLISKAIRPELENPLNFVRNYFGDILGTCVDRVIYLDSDLVVVDDILKLWNTTLTNSRVIGAPEYCHANFTGYFTDEFWSDPSMSRVFQSRKPCYFNTGVMLMDLVRWREGNYTERIENWMKIQKKRRIYYLGSLPPFLLVFAGNVEAIDHRWNQHGLGGDSVLGSCRPLHPGPVSLLHWSGKGKPWVRLNDSEPCPVDLLWEPYDLYKGNEEVKHKSSSASPLMGFF